jgi:hypothetical protein
LCWAHWEAQRKDGWAIFEPVLWVQGWDTQRCASRFVVSHPSQTTRRTPDFLLRSPSHGRVCGFLIRNKFSIKPPLVFGAAGSTTKRRVPHPLRSSQRVGYATVGIEIRGIPPFAKSAKDPGFPIARPQPWLRVRLSVTKAA